MTRDGELVLNHDDDQSRLAMFPHAKAMKRKGKDLDIKQVKRSFNRLGASAPLVSHILDTARCMGGKLVIELKPGSTAVASKLVKLLQQRPEYVPHVGLVMSFDLYLIQYFLKEVLAC